MANYQERPPTAIDPQSAQLLEELSVSSLTVLCGRNNSGKSFLLRKLLEKLGQEAFYLGPARYQNFSVFGSYALRPSRREQRWNQLMQTFRDTVVNADSTPIDLAQTIAELSDQQRVHLLDLLLRLLNARAEILHVTPDNSMSQQYINVDGYNLSFQGSGFRLAAILLACMLNSDHSILIVDEPELGLSPEVQGVIAEFLYDQKQRERYFPHLRAVDDCHAFSNLS
jgi:predicted ATPase